MMQRWCAMYYDYNCNFQNCYETSFGPNEMIQLIRGIQGSKCIIPSDINKMKIFLQVYRNDESPNVLKAKCYIYDLLEGLSIDTLNNILDICYPFPKWLRDSQRQCPKKLLWTGLLLYLYGNNNLVYLGEGSEAAVWADMQGTVYKVYYNEIDWIFPIMNDQFPRYEKDSVRAVAKRITALASADPRKKSALCKYLDLPGSYDHLAIFTSKLALTDYEVTEESRNISEARGKALSISSFISYAKNIVKPLLQLHNKKFSHNDLKLDNLLFIPKDEKRLKEKYGPPDMLDMLASRESVFWDNDRKREVNPYKAVISDFGGVTYLPYEYGNNESPLFTHAYLAPNDPVCRLVEEKRLIPYSNKQKMQANMRDTYACGQTLLLLLLGFSDHELSGNALQEIKDTIQYDSAKEREKLKSKLWNEYLSEWYNEKNKVMDLLDLIFSMMNTDPSKRPSWQSILKKLNKIQESNYDNPEVDYEAPHDNLSKKKILR